MVTNTHELETKLSGFSGTTKYHRGIYKCLKWTDGINAMCELAESFWLMDLVASTQECLKNIDFQVWRIVSEGGVGNVYCNNDRGQTVFTQEIYTDFPEGEFEFWVIGGVALLKSEY